MYIYMSHVCVKCISTHDRAIPLAGSCRLPPLRPVPLAETPSDLLARAAVVVTA